MSHTFEHPGWPLDQKDTTFAEAPFFMGEDLLLLRCARILYDARTVVGVVWAGYDGVAEHFVLDTAYVHVSGADSVRANSVGVVPTWVVEVGTKKYWVRKDSLTVMRWVEPPWDENYTEYIFVRQD